MKIQLVKNRFAFVPKKYAAYCLLLLTTCLGVTLSGCTRFEFNQAKINAEKVLKQQKASNTKCAANQPCECQTSSTTSADKSAPQSDLVAQLDDTLAKTKEAKGWPVSEYDHCKRKMPYHFTVVSVSPTIVIGAPITPLSGAACSANNSTINCLRSKKFMGYYEVGNQLTNAPGLVWFSPEHGPRLFDVPAHANSIFLMIGGQSVRLKRKGDLWVFARKH